MKVLVVNAHDDCPNYIRRLKSETVDTLENNGHDFRFANLYSEHQYLDEKVKVQWSDTLVIQFPLFHECVPVTLKLWFDKVFAFEYQMNKDSYHNHSSLKKRRALLVVSFNGNGDENSHYISEHIKYLLMPIHEALQSVGIFPVAPFVIDQRANVFHGNEQLLTAYRDSLLAIDNVPLLGRQLFNYYDKTLSAEAGSYV